VDPHRKGGGRELAVWDLVLKGESQVRWRRGHSRIATGIHGPHQASVMTSRWMPDSRRHDSNTETALVDLLEPGMRASCPPHPACDGPSPVAGLSLRPPIR
jgi:hypothetical protein